MRTVQPRNSRRAVLTVLFQLCRVLVTRVSCAYDGIPFALEDGQGCSWTGASRREQRDGRNSQVRGSGERARPSDCMTLFRLLHNAKRAFLPSALAGYSAVLQIERRLQVLSSHQNDPSERRPMIELVQNAAKRLPSTAKPWHCLD